MIMWKILFFFIGVSFYMEAVYHVSCFGLTSVRPLLPLSICLLFASICSLLVGFLRSRANKIIFWSFLAVEFLQFSSQLVYIKLFKQPLLVSAATNAGADALTTYWRETLVAIAKCTGYILLFAMPLVCAGILLKTKVITLKSHSFPERIQNIALLTGVASLLVSALVIGYQRETEYYEAYSSFYDPEGVFAEYGVISASIRDLTGDVLPQIPYSLDVWEEAPTVAVNQPSVATSAGSVSVGDIIQGADPSETTPGIDTSPHVLPIDFDSLIAFAPSNEISKLAQYMQSMTPTNKNEYTGMFEGYNLIYLTAEGFSPYAVDETLTPTLYKLIHSGFVFEDYYVPLWYTSTSDGEFINCTGLVPTNQQFNMLRSSEVAMPFTLPSYFAAEGVKSHAYHNNSLSYYDRHLSHPNLGYNFRACKLGDLEESVWGGQVFAMENANAWPASDLDMMVATIPEYIDEDRFHVYYMTVSGHMNYDFRGNRMSSKHKDDVADLPYSEEGRAYIACNMELDAALAYLIEQLDTAGKLENTVICLSADHYPYAMDTDHLEELAGKPLNGTLEIYRNNLILWNSEMETVTVEKTASSLDLLPTLLNLFGFDYDSRLYAGRDILSDSAPLVVFSDRSFITDLVQYNKKAKSTVWTDGTEANDEYFAVIQKQVRGLFNYTDSILNNDFYRYVEEALPEEYRSKIDPEWISPHPPAPVSE